MPAVSKAQQRFMGMVHATQKGDMEAPSKEVEKAADSMKKSDAKDFASTKHKGLPNHVREFIKDVIREVLKSEGAFGSVVDPYDARNLGETSERDVHFKAIMKMYDNGGPFTKKKVGVAVSKNPNVSRNRIVDDLKDMDYTEITDVQDELRIKESTNEAQAVSGGKVNKFITGKNVTLKGKKHSEVDFELVGIDNQKQTVKLKVLVPTELFGQEINIDFRTLRRGPFLKTDTSKAESVNEGLYHVGYNKGRGQGTGVFKDSYSSYKDAKKAVEKLEKERGGSYNQIAYYVADKDGKFVRESVNEAAGKEAMGIAGFTGTRGDAVQKFIDTHNINADKLFNFIKKGKLSDRMDFVKALVGNPNNPIQKKMIKMFGESMKESTPGLEAAKDFNNHHASSSYTKDMGHGPELDTIDFDDLRDKKHGHQYDTKDTQKRGYEPVKEEHDCGCNENHDCGCGGLHQH